MKKLFVALMAMMTLSSATFAQKTIKKVKATTSAVTDTAKHYKKDGTLDKRYKSSKNAVHLKKDGTADKRFKENKTAVKKAA